MPKVFRRCVKLPWRRIFTLALILQFTFVVGSTPYASIHQTGNSYSLPETITASLNQLDDEFAVLQRHPSYEKALVIYGHSILFVENFIREDFESKIDREFDYIQDPQKKNQKANDLRKRVGMFIAQQHNPLANAIGLAWTIAETSAEPRLLNLVLAATMNAQPDLKGMEHMFNQHIYSDDGGFKAIAIGDLTILRVSQSAMRFRSHSSSKPSAQSSSKPAVEGGLEVVPSKPIDFGRQLALETQKQLVRQYWLPRALLDDRYRLPESDEEIITRVMGPIEEDDRRELIESVAMPPVMPSRYVAGVYPLRLQLAENILVLTRDPKLNPNKKTEIAPTAEEIRRLRLSGLEKANKEYAWYETIGKEAQWRFDVMDVIWGYLSGSGRAEPEDGVVNLIFRTTGVSSADADFQKLASDFVTLHPSLYVPQVKKVLEDTYRILKQFSNPGVLTPCWERGAISKRFSEDQKSTLIQFFHLLSPSSSLEEAFQKVDKGTLLQSAENNTIAKKELEFFLEYLDQAQPSFIDTSTTSGWITKLTTATADKCGNLPIGVLRHYFEDENDGLIKRTFLNTVGLAHIAPGQTDNHQVQAIIMQQKTLMVADEPLLQTSAIRNLKPGEAITDKFLRQALDEQAKAIQEAADVVKKLRRSLEAETDEKRQLSIINQMTQLNLVDAWRLAASNWEYVWIVSQVIEYKTVLDEKVRVFQNWAMFIAVGTLMILAFWFLGWAFLMIAPKLLACLAASSLTAAIIGTAVTSASTVSAGSLFITQMMGTISAGLMLWIVAELNGQARRSRLSVIAGLGGDMEKASLVMNAYENAQFDAVFAGVSAILPTVLLLSQVRGFAHIPTGTKYLNWRTATTTFKSNPRSILDLFRDLWKTNKLSRDQWIKAVKLMEEYSSLTDDAAEQVLQTLQRKIASDPSWAASAEGQVEIFAALSHRSNHLKTTLSQFFQRGNYFKAQIQDRAARALRRTGGDTKIRELTSKTSLSEDEVNTLLREQIKALGLVVDPVTDSSQSMAIAGRFIEDRSYFTSAMQNRWNQLRAREVNVQAILKELGLGSEDEFLQTFANHGLRDRFFRLLAHDGSERSMQAAGKMAAEYMYLWSSHMLSGLGLAWQGVRVAWFDILFSIQAYQEYEAAGKTYCGPSRLALLPKDNEGNYPATGLSSATVEIIMAQKAVLKSLQDELHNYLGEVSAKTGLQISASNYTILDLPHDIKSVITDYRLRIALETITLESQIPGEYLTDCDVLGG